MYNYSCEDIMFVADYHNVLPRKFFGYKTPDELFGFEFDTVYVS